MHYTARCCPAPLRKKRKKKEKFLHQPLRIRVSHRTTRGSFEDKWSTPCFPASGVWLWRLLQSPLKINKWMNRKRRSIIRDGNGRKRTEEKGGRQGGRLAGCSCLKITALSFSASTLEFSGFFLLSFFPSSVSMQPQHCIGDQRTRSLHGYCYCPLFPSDVKPRQAKRLRNSLSVCNMQKNQTPR